MFWRRGLQCFGGGACSVLEGCAIFGGALQCFEEVSHFWKVLAVL